MSESQSTNTPVQNYKPVFVQFNISLYKIFLDITNIYIHKYIYTYIHTYSCDLVYFYKMQSGLTCLNVPEAVKGPRRGHTCHAGSINCGQMHLRDAQRY